MALSTVEIARLLALVNTAMADAGIAIWESKYYYDFWRPITGIREADAGTGPTGKGDGNPATVADPNFTPLGSPASNLNGPNFTPPFPAYPSGHAGFGAEKLAQRRNDPIAANLFDFIESRSVFGTVQGWRGRDPELVCRFHDKRFDLCPTSAERERNQANRILSPLSRVVARNEIDADKRLSVFRTVVFA
jgi:hypothetical protein